MAALSSKLEAIRNAKQRYERIRQGHAKLLEEDFSEVEEEQRSRYKERQGCSWISMTPSIANSVSSHGTSRRRNYEKERVFNSRPVTFGQGAHLLRGTSCWSTPIPAPSDVVVSRPPAYDTTCLQSKHALPEAGTLSSFCWRDESLEEKFKSFNSFFDEHENIGTCQDFCTTACAPTLFATESRTKNRRVHGAYGPRNSSKDFEVPLLLEDLERASSFSPHFGEAICAVRAQLEFGADFWSLITGEVEYEVALTQALTVTTMSGKAIEGRREVKESLRRRRLSEEASSFARREIDLVWREKRARERVEKLEHESEEQRAKARAADSTAARVREHSMTRQFARARQALSAVVAQQRVFFREQFGRTGDDAIISLKYKSNWEVLPQPIEIRLHVVQAVKDRLPKGQYVVLLSVLDQLGGRPLGWLRHPSSHDPFGNLPSATRPIKHRGRFHDVQLRIHESVFALCPPREVARPGNTLVFEVYRLSDKKRPRDVVVGWFALPMCEPENFGIVEGKFRLPVLRGPVNRAIKRFSDVHDIIARDLAAWLGNVYFEIRHLPCKVIDEHGLLGIDSNIEYDLVNKLQLPKHVQNSRLNDPPIQDEDHAANDSNVRDEHLVGGALIHSALSVVSEREDVDVAWWGRRHNVFCRRGLKVRREGIANCDWDWPCAFDSRESSPLREQLKQNENDEVYSGNNAPSNPSQKDTAMLVAAPKMSTLCGCEVGADIKDSKVLRLVNDSMCYYEKRLIIEKESAKSVHREYANGDKSRNRVEEYNDPDILKEKARIGKEAMQQTQKNWWTDISSPGAVTDNIWHDFTPAVGPPKMHRRPLSIAAVAGTKVMFIWQAMFQDLVHDVRSAFCAPSRQCLPVTCCLCDIKSRYLRMSVFIGAFWTRAYVHYLGQWILLSGLRVVVYGLRTQVYAIEFKYPPDRMTTLGEVAFVATGPFSVLLCFAILIGCGHLYRYLSHEAPLPEIYSYYMSAFGLAAILDPVLILLVDVVLENYTCTTRVGCREDYTLRSCHCFEGDAFKLMRRLTDEEDGGVVGAFYTLIIYFITSTLAFGLLCIYLFDLHANGRIYDMYCRIFGEEGDFFLPDDFEISLRELNFALVKARSWCGPENERREIVVSEMQVTEDHNVVFKEARTHVTIYESHRDGVSWLYRSFFRAPDGTVQEVFGQAPRTVKPVFIDISSDHGHSRAFLGCDPVISPGKATTQG
eukprot:CAMPEP_0198654318 /NCGR_PEP_ID=MMETSP1467-20131203/7634_1 /TAXON_ID=1462469 /ORGANISM="unid. sp., Strain CCMP2135" /LENGTH=1207 /DNA_ID=CAMNT_0044390303 /DNA_START=292 /DNA_END=3918 /DNA_ORIENTATION=-